MYDFKHVEEEVLKIWKKHAKALEESYQHDSKKKLFSFLEGPPTANAPPALHHVEMRTFKDLFCKYKFMQGFSVPRQGGWDCHGLPVEVQVEKALGLQSKKEVIDYGIAKFNKQCRDSVFEYIKEWEANTKRVHYLVDLEKPYVTLERDYMESVWWSLKELHKKGLLYEGKKVVPYCPRCETPLSHHEVSQGYKEVRDATVVVSFPLVDEPDTSILAWTTTPWTLPSNLALAVGSNIEYVKVAHEGKKYILAKDLVNKYFEQPTIIETFHGKELLGKKYEPLFPYFVSKFSKTKAWSVIEASHVTTDDGTGIVHMAPAFGEDDFEACQKNKIPFIQPIDTAGLFTKEVPDFKGMFVKKADKHILEYLENQGSVFKVEHYAHQYPYCWRCSTPLLYYATDSWFIKVTEIKKKLLKHNKEIKWYPNHIKDGRFGKWLEGARDWALSRKKFWGTPLPVWRSEDGDEVVIGSVKELEDLSGKKIPDLHKPFIDTVTFTKEGKKYTRVSDVIDTWYDSGSASFAQFHYPFENKKYFEERFPYDFIAEAIDQTRGWFYTSHVLATALFDKPAYRSVVCAGHLVDEKGEKMSKSKGNVLVPAEVFDAVGVDAVRLQMCATSVGEQKKFSIHLVNESILPFLNILFNTYRFTSQAATLTDKKPKELALEDQWMLSRVNSLVTEVTENIEQHNYHGCLKSCVQFVNGDFSRWYIKLIRDRSKDLAVGYVLQYVFDRLIRLLAPFIPYLPEYLHAELFSDTTSVHLTQWPKVDTKVIDATSEETMDVVREVTSLILAEREKAQIGVRWPLAKATVMVPKGMVARVKQYEALILAQANIKALVVAEGNIITIKVDKRMTKALEEEGFYRGVSRKVQSMRKKMGLVAREKISLVIESEYSIETFKDQLQERVGATNLDFGTVKGDFDLIVEEKIKNQTFKIAINKA